MTLITNDKSEFLQFALIFSGQTITKHNYVHFFLDALFAGIHYLHFDFEMGKPVVEFLFPGIF